MPLKRRSALMVLEEKPNLGQIYSLVGKPCYVDQFRYKIE
jgi:hypothetical protein